MPNFEMDLETQTFVLQEILLDVLFSYVKKHFIKVCLVCLDYSYLYNLWIQASTL